MLVGLCSQTPMASYYLNCTHWAQRARYQDHDLLKTIYNKSQKRLDIFSWLSLHVDASNPMTHVCRTRDVLLCFVFIFILLCIHCCPLHIVVGADCILSILSIGVAAAPA